MAKIESHRDLLVWQKSMDLTVLVYKLTQKFPSNEMYRLISQMTRSAASYLPTSLKGMREGADAITLISSQLQKVR